MKLRYETMLRPPPRELGGELPLFD